MTCINVIRNFSGIKEIIISCSAFGRTWGKIGSKLYGSHIAFINPEELVLLVQDKKSGQIRLINYVKADKSDLGGKVELELKNNSVAYLVE